MKQLKEIYGNPGELFGSKEKRSKFPFLHRNLLPPPLLIHSLLWQFISCDGVIAVKMMIWDVTGMAQCNHSTKTEGGELN